MSTPRKLLVAAVFPMLISLAHADQISFTNSGGSTSVSSGVTINSNVATPAGSLTLNCPQTSPTICSGGSFSFASSDGTNTINGTFTSGKFTETCAGGGKGGHITCAYSFSGYISGTSTVNGVSQGVVGETSQGFGTGGAAAQGSTAFVSAYTPFYYSDSEQIHRSDDLQGTNQISFDGAQGGGFYGAYGLALDAAGRIYVSDTYNCRVVRTDDMIGTNWTTYGGTCGSGQGQFYDPSGIAVDSTGRIYVMDTGNSRLVRIDDMSGTNWVTFSSVGTGTGQLSQFLSVAVDSAGRIYVPDAGRLVRMDDMTGANFTVLTQSPPINGYSYIFEQPIAVALDSTGRIYVADNVASGATVVRVDDMTGTNWTSIVTSPTGSTGLNSISVDGSGTAFTGGGGAKAIVNMAAVLNSSGSVGPIGSYYVFGVTALPLPSPRPSAVSLNPGTLNFSQNVGTTGSLPLIISNFGGSPLNIGTITASNGFSETNTCPGQLPGGSTCTVTVSFAPSATGPVSGSLTITDDSWNLGTTQSVTLTGTGTAPAASVTPASLTFSSQVLNTSSSAKTVTLQDTGTGPMQVSNVAVTGPFSQTNNCGSLAAGASCTIQVVFTPIALGTATGSLTITDDAGTQTVTLSGNGSAPVTFSPSNLNFGAVAAGNTSATMTVTVNNRSTAALNFTSIVASTGFTIASNTCGTGIAAGANCAVGVTFTPAATGSVTGTLTFTDSAATSPQTVNLSGSGSTAVTFSSTTVNFGSIAVGSTSSVKNVTMTNRQSVPLNISGIATSAGFAVASTTCGAALNAGASCTIGLTFTPAALGTATGTMTVTDDAPNSPQVVNLTGTGAAPVSASPSSLSFSAAVGTTSSARTVTLSNRQSVALNISGITISTSFAIASTTCGASLAAGANCTVSVTFSPTTSGPITGTLTVTDDAPNSPQTVNLTGNSNNNN